MDYKQIRNKLEASDFTAFSSFLPGKFKTEISKDNFYIIDLDNKMAGNTFIKANQLIY